MSRRILLIGNDKDDVSSSSYYNEYKRFFERSLAREADETVEILWTLLHDLAIEVGDEDFSVYDTKTQKDIADYDIIIIRGTGFRHQFDVLKTISSYAAHHRTPIINDYHAFRDYSKLMQAVQFFENGLPVAKTVYVNRAVMSGAYTPSFSFPCVMKEVFGSHGNDNYIVHNLEDVVRIASDPSKRFVLQRFVQNDGDYRVLVAGNKVRVIGRKATGDSHLNNTSQGGNARLVALEELPSGMVDDAIKIARALDMGIAGVDALVDTVTQEYSFLEVNSQPQLMTGAYIEEKEQLVGAYLASLL